MRLLLIFLSLSISFLKAQLNDSIIGAPLIGVHFGGDLPMGDLSSRFGPNLNAGINFTYKTSKNYLIGIDGNYMFGRNIKEDVLAPLKTDKNFIIDNSGYPADIRVSQRILNVQIQFGKIFPFLSANPNSGLMVKAGAGYMMHQIHFVDIQKQISAVGGDMARGYDRMTHGPAFSQFVGYIYLSDNRITNFYFGFEAYQGLTRSVRKLNYDTGMPDTKLRFDALAGLRFGWILPLYSRAPKQYFYN
jgi:hypothetical protein